MAQVKQAQSQGRWPSGIRKGLVGAAAEVVEVWGKRGSKHVMRLRPMVVVTAEVRPRTNEATGLVALDMTSAQARIFAAQIESAANAADRLEQE